MNFPFVRGQFHSIGLLRSFLKCISVELGKNSVLSSAILARKLPRAKLWEEELFPLLLYCDYNRLPDEGEFQIMPEGREVDATLRDRSCQITRFQITTAYREEDAASSRGGYIASIERQAINKGIPVFLGGIRKDKAGQITSKPVARYAADDAAEWRSGLINAIQNKISKPRYYGNVEFLLVFADRLVFDLLNQDHQTVVLSAIHAAVEGIKVLPFQKLIVLDRDPRGYVEYGNSNSELCGP
ncbi:MAG: hypothetical protein ACREET_04635 [Stellaceae bacterium]